MPVSSHVGACTSLHLVRSCLSEIANSHVSTQPMSPEEALTELNRQRSLRPNSPWHIYQPQMTSITSIGNRVTGVGLSVGMYAIFLGHLAGLDSASLVAFWADLPGWFQYTVKGAIAFAGSYHTLNGIRHLAWDMVKGAPFISDCSHGGDALINPQSSTSSRRTRQAMRSSARRPSAPSAS